MYDTLLQALQQNDTSTFLQELKECKINARLSPDNQKWMELYIKSASQSQYKEFLELLLEYADGIFFNKSDQVDGKNALHNACENGCDENVLILLQKGCNPDDKMKLSEKTALHIASNEGHLKIVEHLLNYNVNINERDCNGRTPLHLAAMSGHIEVSRFLLEQRADTQSVDSDGCHPLHEACCEYGHFNITRLLLDYDSTMLNTQDKRGVTPLMRALANRNVPKEDIQYLLEQGAKTEFYDEYNRTTVHYAVIPKNHEILSLILQSTDMKWMEECFLNYLNEEFEKGSFQSLIHQTIESFNPKSVLVLLTSALPKSILWVPFIEETCSTADLAHTPLTYILIHSLCFDEDFDSCLHLLLKNKITMQDEYSKIVQVKWPAYDHEYSDLVYCHPYSEIIGYLRPHFSDQYYLNLLIENDVTTDYCLQSFHNNTEPFISFNTYDLYYKPIIDAIQKGDIEIIKFLMSNSVILEPENLLVYLFSGYKAIMSAANPGDIIYTEHPNTYSI